MKLGGCVAAWQHGFNVGVWGFFVACLLVAIAYTMLNLCVAEITSIIVFPGAPFCKLSMKGASFSHTIFSIVQVVTSDTYEPAWVPSGASSLA